MQARLEAYLEELERPLKGLSVEARSEWREEARQHLAALVEAHEELGRTPEEAVEAAIASFGSAEQLGREMRRELTPHVGEQFFTGLRRSLLPWRSRAGTSWEGVGRAFGLFGLPVFVVQWIVAVVFLALMLSEGPPVPFLVLMADDRRSALVVLAQVGQFGYWLAPLLGGAWLGRWSRPERSELQTNLAGLLVGLVGAWPFANFLRLVAAGFSISVSGWEYLPFWLAHGLGAYVLTRLASRRRQQCRECDRVRA